MLITFQVLAFDNFVSRFRLCLRPYAQVQRGLHVVFTMNPASDGFEGRCATSPALFNRCVVDWFGTWPTKALAQVTGSSGTSTVVIAPPVFDELMDKSAVLIGFCHVNHRVAWLNRRWME